MRELFYNLLKKVFFIFFILLVFIPGTRALGTLQKKSYLEINPEQVAEFGILFWNSEDLPINVNLDIMNKPDEWLVIIEPKDFIIQKNITSSEIIISQDRHINVLPVKILVIPQKNAKAGVYEILIKMVSGREEKGISFFQEKNFNFRVNITGIEEEKEFVNETISDLKRTENFTTSTEKIEKLREGPSRISILSLLILLFLMISWIIYRL